MIRTRPLLLSLLLALNCGCVPVRVPGPTPTPGPAPSANIVEAAERKYDATVAAIYSASADEVAAGKYPRVTDWAKSVAPQIAAAKAARDKVLNEWVAQRLGTDDQDRLDPVAGAACMREIAGWCLQRSKR